MVKNYQVVIKNMFKNVVFIPARGGSKSIPLKNIKIINGRPLIYWVLDAVIKCDDIERVFVSTDNDNIKRIVNEYDNFKIEVIDRCLENATDFATTESAMIEFANDFLFENIVLVQATSPLLESEYLIDGLKKFNDTEIDSVLSVVRQKRFLWEDTNKISKPINYNPNDRPMRQKFKGYLVENGAFYITSRKSLLETRCRISGNIGLVEMPEKTYFELDEESDWIIIENFLINKH